MQAQLTEGQYSTIREIPKGEYFRLKENGPVYVRGQYCNGMYNGKRINRYSCTKADDMNAERLLKGEQVVIIGFTY